MDGSTALRGSAGEAFQADWYARAYPQVRDDIRRGLAKDPADHYARYGRFRGYLPNPSAERPRNPAGVRSAFGGLWTDQGNALDIVEGRLELGLIDRKLAEALRAYIRDGYVVFRNAIPRRELIRARRALEDAYDGKIRGQQFNCPELGVEVGAWDERMKALPAKALEIHAHSSAIRDAIFSPVVSRFLAVIFDRRALATQSLGFYRGSGQNGHQDSAYVTYTLPLQFAASWIALEDVKAGAGELFYRVGSQNLGDFLYAGEFKSVREAQRLRPDWDAAEMDAHVNSLRERSDQIGHPEKTFLAKAGDVLIWASDLVHGGKPISLDRTRKSVVTHYCPRDVAPLYMEEGARREIHRHKSGNAWTTFL